MRRFYHWLMIWPCLWIGGPPFHKEENWWSDKAVEHWLLSRKDFQPR